MALQDIATVADLTARNITVPAGVEAGEFLAAAQDAVRDAAGVPITRETFTVTIGGRADQWLDLPGQPVVVVADVELDAVAVTDWKLVDGRLWRRDGWEAIDAPSNVTLTITGGLITPPKDIVDLVCSLAGLGMSLAGDGEYASRGDQIGMRIDDYSEQYASGSGDRTAGPLELPELTRDRLRARFGGSVALVRSL
ncbi:hypothetical protein DMH01_03325 [Amycolatopsis sp. WAC 04182]|uniref:hypothetical protein n=1 Tax=Amycolatopsis sp. WAC 04182 TaxID=2203198 RepID=UPI000F7A5017|nr:hypothetical protein [Amycolatopsis sp. WAC 04182]RSN65422.1 hypothetical protein DMH01_03325 [Amycolatopsis sp. WAC 04182]